MSPRFLLTKLQTSAQSLLAHQNKSSRLSWILVALTYGYQVPNADRLPATSTRSSTPLLRPATKQTDPSLKSATDLRSQGLHLRRHAENWRSKDQEAALR